MTRVPIRGSCPGVGVDGPDGVAADRGAGGQSVAGICGAGADGAGDGSADGRRAIQNRESDRAFADSAGDADDDAVRGTDWLAELKGADMAAAVVVVAAALTVSVLVPGSDVA